MAHRSSFTPHETLSRSTGSYDAVQKITGGNQCQRRELEPFAIVELPPSRLNHRCLGVRA